MVEVLVRVSFPVQNIMIKKHVGEERDYSVYTSTLLFITKRSQARKQEARSQGHEEMFLTGLLSLLSYRT